MRIRVIKSIRNIISDASMFLCSLGFAKVFFDDGQDEQDVVSLPQIGIACQIVVCVIDIFLSSKAARSSQTYTLLPQVTLPQATERPRWLRVTPLLIDVIKMALVASEAGLIYSSEQDSDIAIKLIFLTLIQAGEAIVIPIKYCYELKNENDPFAYADFEQVNVACRGIMLGLSTFCLLITSIFAKKSDDDDDGSLAFSVLTGSIFNGLSVISDIAHLAYSTSPELR